MKCPTCGENTPDAWLPVLYNGQVPEMEGAEETPHRHRISLSFMRCANDNCKQLVIHGRDDYTRYAAGMPERAIERWLVYPRHRVRPVDPLVPDDLRRDFEEAVAILDTSHRMSAVLGRRILGDLLEKYAGLTQFKLSERIDRFAADAGHPRALRENLHYLREMGDFSAHTQTNDQLEVIDIDPEEAEWTLDVVERLFEYFIVGPERDRAMREGIDAKLDEAKRKKIEPLPPDAPRPS